MTPPRRGDVYGRTIRNEYGVTYIDQVVLIRACTRSPWREWYAIPDDGSKYDASNAQIIWPGQSGWKKANFTRRIEL